MDSLLLGSVNLEVLNPKVIGEGTLRFSLLISQGGWGLLEVRGFRLHNRALTAPASRDGKGRYYPMAVLTDKFCRGIVKAMKAAEWDKKFTEVSFPEVEVEEGNNK